MTAISGKHPNTGRRSMVIGAIALFLLSTILFCMPSEDVSAEAVSDTYIELNYPEEAHFTIYVQTDDGWVAGGEAKVAWVSSTEWSTWQMAYNRSYGYVEWSIGSGSISGSYLELPTGYGSWEKSALSLGNTTHMSLNISFRLSDVPSFGMIDNADELTDCSTNYTATTEVNFDLNGGSGSFHGVSVPYSGDTFDPENMVSVTIPSDEPVRKGYRFDGWTLTPSGDPVYQHDQTLYRPIGSEITLYAKWVADSVDVVFMANGSPYDTQTVDVGDYVNPPEDPEPPEGMIFAGWFTDEAATTAFDFSQPVNNPLTLYAGWEEELEFTSKPVAEINVTPIDGHPGTVLFDASGSSDYERVLWDFGDGGTSENTIVTHYYDHPGSYEVTLTVYKTVNGEVSSGTDTFTIVVPGDDPSDSTDILLYIALGLAIVVIVIFVARRAV